MTSLIETLQKRGFVEGMTNEQLASIVEQKKPIRVYCGFDPTADSLHIGHLMTIMALCWFRKFGHTPVVIVGGATGGIGDPSGRSQERNLLSNEQVLHNVAAIQSTLQTIMDRIPGKESVILLNNHDWIGTMSFIEFLRDVGRYFRVGTMLGKEMVKTRLAAEDGLSYTEFSYQLLQAYDFYHLHTHHDVSLQIGGSDQWGNIISGIDFVRKKTGKEVFGLTIPLLLKSDGKKFGKSESGAVWLSATHLSPYDFYQYLIRTSDDDVIRLLKALTFVELSCIEQLEKQMSEPGYVPFTAQKLLAKEVTLLVHGQSGLDQALQTTAASMPGQETVVLTGDSIRQLQKGLPSYSVSSSELIGKRFCDIIADLHIIESRSEGKRLIKNGGLAVNNKKIADEVALCQKEDCIEDKFLIISLGKKQRVVIEMI